MIIFNLFSEAEPFAAVLIAHGTHVFGTNSCRAKIFLRPKVESGEGVLEEGQRAPFPIS